MINYKSIQANPSIVIILGCLFFFTFPSVTFYGAYFQFSKNHSPITGASLLGIGFVLTTFFILILCNEYLKFKVTKEFIEVKRPLYNFIVFKQKAYSKFECKKVKLISLKRFVNAKGSHQICRIISNENTVLKKFKFDP